MPTSRRALPGARAVVVPSLVYETFGYVVLEAFQERTPVVVRNLGALPELVAESGGGLVFKSSDELVSALDRLTTDERLAIDLATRIPGAAYAVVGGGSSQPGLQAD